MPLLYVYLHPFKLLDKYFYFHSFHFLYCYCLFIFINLIQYFPTVCIFRCKTLPMCFIVKCYANESSAEPHLFGRSVLRSRSLCGHTEPQRKFVSHLLLSFQRSDGSYHFLIINYQASTIYFKINAYNISINRFIKRILYLALKVLKVNPAVSGFCRNLQHGVPSGSGSGMSSCAVIFKDSFIR